MVLNIRRVVTGHNGDAKAVIIRDQEMQNITVMPSGNSAALLWVMDETPGGVDGDDDPSDRAMGIAPPDGGSAFRALELMPGKDAFMHRTNSIDYVIIMEGECVMVLDDGTEVTMRAGDVMVQRGTWHGWANRSDKPCRIIFVLISAQPPAQSLHDSLGH